MEFVKLANGLETPKVFFGTYRVTDTHSMEEVLQKAYACGYRSFDSASFYQNEQAIGDAFRSMDVMDDILLTTKVWNDVEGYDAVLRAFEESEKKLGKIDIYLLHWPAREFLSRWKALEDLYAAGRVRAIGVSNFKKHHLEELKKHSKVRPMINQIEAHGYFMDEETVAYCREKGIALQAWRPLMRTGNMLENADIQKIGQKYGKSAAQVALRYLIQRGFTVIPKSVHLERMRENIDIFDFALTEEEMCFMRTLNTGKRTAGDPDTFILP